MGRHTEPGTGAPAPDRGFWVRAGVLGVAAVLVGTYLLVRDGDGGTSATPKVSTTASPTTSTAAAGSAPSPSGSSTSTTPSPPSPSSTEPAPTLTLRVLRESFITVRVPGGRTLVSRLFRAGQEASFDQRVLEVVNGRPSAVRFTVNGEPRRPGPADQPETFTVRRR